MPSTLADRLDRIRAGAAERIPRDAIAVMHAATAALERSGQAETAIGVGDLAPDFTLPDAEGRPVSSAALRAQGPLVLTFFRGHW